MAQKKHPTCKQLLIKLINELDPIQVAILHERIWTMTEDLLSQKEDILALGKNHIIEPQYYINTLQAIHDGIKIDYSARN